MMTLSSIKMTTAVAYGASTYLGPARIAKIDGDRVLLAFPDQHVWAVLAVAMPYQAALEDVVLAIGQDEAWYVIGVLKASGDTVLRVNGNLKLEAPNGKIELKSGEEISLMSVNVRVIADRLEVVARAVAEKFQTASRWVKELFHMRAGSVHAQVKETYRVQAGRIAERAAGDVHIDGKKIHLG
jgi:hypothetical protein